MTDDRKIYSVFEINHLAKMTLQDELGTIWLEGEVSRITDHSSGHLYFTIKDEKAAIDAKVWKSTRRSLKEEPANGMKIQARGRLDIWEQAGRYSITVDQVQEAGKGSLQEAFEKLKAKLEAEGLFSPECKKAIPLLPRKIGVVTSSTGAAIRDILNVISRRFPNVHIVIASAKVQGDDAAIAIAEAIGDLNRLGDVDVMIIGRGGGSMEDLWAFNEEVVARAIAASKIPIISAVGHEIDFTISDFVADRRAETPSAAAEMVIRPKKEMEKNVEQSRNRLIREASHRLAQKQQSIDEIGAELKNHVIHESNRRRITISRFETTLRALSPQSQLRRHIAGLTELREQLATLSRSRVQRELRLKDEIVLRLKHGAANEFQRASSNLKSKDSHLRALSPLSVLTRGFSMTCGPDGRTVEDADCVSVGDKLTTTLARGVLISKVTDKEDGARNATEKTNQE